MAPGLLDCLPDVPDCVVCDHGLASDTFRDRIWDIGGRPAIPPRRTDAPVACPPWIYANRHLVENLWARLKGWRSVATPTRRPRDPFSASFRSLPRLAQALTDPSCASLETSADRKNLAVGRADEA